MFADRLYDAIKQKNNPSVVGLDPKIEYIPQDVLHCAQTGDSPEPEAAADAILAFNKALIDAVGDLVPAVKPQLAYYERYGWQGMRAFAETVRYAKSKGLLVIADGKRNDIGPTAEAYAAGMFGADGFNADALTVNGYLGTDGIKPFASYCADKGKGIFVLVKTSNPSSGELQDLELADGRSVSEAMAAWVSRWGEDYTGKSGFSSVGAVVGATYPRQAARLRKLMPHAILLIPGYGAQGGGAEDAAAGFAFDGTGAIVNASRSIMCAWKNDKYKNYGECRWQEAARAETIRMRDELNAALEKRTAG